MSDDFCATALPGDDLAPMYAGMAPLLFADRFLVLRSETALDLASGEFVWLLTNPVAGRRSRDQWLRRCAALSGLWHPHLVGLADFGTTGQDGSFEAWECPSPPPGWTARNPATAQALIGVAGFLMANRLRVGRLPWSRVVSVQGRLALLPGEETGVPVDLPDPAAKPTRPAPAGAGERLAARLARMAEACGARSGCAERSWESRTQATPSAANTSRQMAEVAERLVEVLDHGVSGCPRSVRIGLPRGPAGALLRRTLARTARLRGYVPVTTELLERDAGAAVRATDWRAALAGRHVVLICSNPSHRHSEAVGLFFLALGLASDRPHVLVQIEEVRHGVLAVGPAAWSTRTQALRVREERVAYGAENQAARPRLAAVTPEPVPSVIGWPLSGAARLRGSGVNLAAGIEAASRGRHAVAERLLRDAIGRCSRRDEDGAAGEAALVLGRLLLFRGRLAGAAWALETSRQHFERARLPGMAVVTAVFLGLSWTDAGRLSEAEAALRAADISARETAQEGGGTLAVLGLARCLFWQGRVQEAGECLSQLIVPVHGEPPVEAYGSANPVRAASGGLVRERCAMAFAPQGDPMPDRGGQGLGAVDFGVGRACLLARLGVAVDDLAGAGRAAAEARELAERSGSPTDMAAACCAGAVVYGALGDADALSRIVRHGLEAARHARAPLRAIRLRVMLANGLTSAGRQSEAAPVLARLRRLDGARLPWVVRVPLERVLSGHSTQSSAATGSPPASGVCARAGRHGIVMTPARPDVAETIVEILTACQTAEDDDSILAQVAAVLRGRIRAISVVCLGRDRDAVVALVADGSAAASEATGERAMDAGLAIAPGSSRSGLEAAVPIQFAGVTVGALACRWSADAPPDWARVGAVLAAAAAAVAPWVRATLDRRACSASPSSGPADQDIVGVGEAVAGLRREIARAAGAPFNVIIEGESGCGKELVARAIHRLGPRRHRPLCALNCAALSDELVEAELFGHSRGAFTGAVAERKGLFEEADRGTLVLDEVGELTARAQAKLLRAIQEGEIRRVGENFARAVDVRIIAATNRPLRPAVEAGSFRQDLLYRLEVIRIAVPPLRARVEDIPILAGHFWREACARVASRSTLAPATLAALARYDWPGNVRELQNVMAALAVAAGPRGSVGPDRLPAIIARQVADERPSSLDQARRGFEARFVRAALAKAGGRRALAARDLGLTRQGLAKLMMRLGIE